MCVRECVRACVVCVRKCVCVSLSEGVRQSALVLCAYTRECLCTHYLDTFVSVLSCRQP